MSDSYYERTTCRLCGNDSFATLIDLGAQPPANAFLAPETIGDEEHYPLHVVRCVDPECGFVQLKHVVDPEILFGEYVYVSSTSPVFVKHFENYAQSMDSRLGLEGALTLDIGSNDGILVRPLKALGAQALGVDPARAIAERATAEGLETLVGYFTESFAKYLTARRSHAKLITANNVFAHIDDLDEIMRGVRVLLARDGLFVIEAPYLLDYLDKNLYDTTYHEHLSYLAIKPLQKFFENFGMHIVDVDHVDSHGGSARIMVAHRDSDFTETPTVATMIRDEEKRSSELFKKFAQAVGQNKESLTEMLGQFKQQGKKIAAYGAPAKGNTLLNFMQIGPETLDYIVDDNPLKQGLVSPGMHVPVVPSTALVSNPPDYLVILAWNFAPSIMEKNQDFAARGGKFIVPMPMPHVV